MDPVTLAEALKQAEQLSSHSDRYLFVVALICMGCGTVWAIRYLVNTIEAMNSAHQLDHKLCEDKLTSIVATQNESRERLIKVTEQNTSILEQCTQQLVRIKNL